jgi:hypothetical protein
MGGILGKSGGKLKTLPTNLSHTHMESLPFADDSFGGIIKRCVIVDHERGGVSFQG